jgi:hypothetical protein
MDSDRRSFLERSKNISPEEIAWPFRVVLLGYSIFSVIVLFLWFIVLLCSIVWCGFNFGLAFAELSTSDALNQGLESLATPPKINDFLIYLTIFIAPYLIWTWKNRDLF